MPEEQEKQDSHDAEAEAKAAANIDWLTPESGIHDVYANIVHVNWGPYDIRTRFGRLIADPRAASPTKAKWVVMEEAAVTLSYGEAKYLRDLLHGLIKDYEAKNGEIKDNPVLPAPTAPIAPS